jgi:hypothetical protein
VSSSPSLCSWSYASSDTAASRLVDPLKTCFIGTLSHSISCSILSSRYNDLRSRFARRSGSPGVTGGHGQQSGGSSHLTCAVGSKIWRLVELSEDQPQATQRKYNMNRMMARSRKNWKARESPVQILQRAIRLNLGKIVCKYRVVATHRSNITSDLFVGCRASVPPLARTEHICGYQDLCHVINYSRIAPIQCLNCSEYPRRQRGLCRTKSTSEVAPQVRDSLLEAIWRVFQLPFKTFICVKREDEVEFMAVHPT